MSVTSLHLQYWRDRGVSDEITRLNVTSLDDEKQIAGLINWKGWKNGAGWVVRGIDPCTGHQTDSGLQFRPDEPLQQRDEQNRPKFDQNGNPKVQKFISRAKEPASPLFLRMPDPDYWSKLIKDVSQPVFILEGAAKAGALLTHGKAGISIPGVTTGQKLDRLKDGLLPFCSSGRPVYLCFDADLATNSNVRRALKRLGELLTAKGCVVSVVLWDVSLGKGADDFIVNEGIEAFESAIARALTFKEWTSMEPDQVSDNISSDHDPTSDGEFTQTVIKRLYSGTRWICVSGQLYQWTGKHYASSPDEIELKRIRDLADSLGFYNEKLKRTVCPYAKPSHVKAALEWVKMTFPVRPEQCNPPGLNCTNGVMLIDWEGREPSFRLAEHNPDLYYLYEPLATYNPDASDEDCDRLLAALEPAQQQVLLRTVAAAFDIEAVRKYHGRLVRAILAKGTGSNGKDAHREAFAMLWGRDGMVSCSFEDFQQYDEGRKFPLIGLRNARLSWASENRSKVPLDQLQSLKRAITGDSLHYEAKGKDHQEFTPQAVLFFNVNDVPNLKAGLEAIKSRYAVLSYDKTYKVGADESKGELEADSRLKYDSEFIEQKILPALLNRLIQAFKDLMAEGIDYSCCDAALEEIQIHNSHLFEFAKESGLTFDADAELPIKELWLALEDYYQRTGVLTISTDGRRTWEEPIRPGDQYVKASNQIPQRFIALYPQAKKERIPGSNNQRIKGLKFADPTSQQVSDIPEKPKDVDNATNASTPKPKLETVEAAPSVDRVGTRVIEMRMGLTGTVVDVEAGYFITVKLDQPIELEDDDGTVETTDRIQRSKDELRVEAREDASLIAQYSLAFKQAAQTLSKGADLDKKLTQLIEEAKSLSDEVRQAIWQELPKNLKSRIQFGVLKQRSDLARR